MKMEMTLKKLNRKLSRYKEYRDELVEMHKGNEEKFTYWAGYKLGYVKGKIDEIETVIDELTNAKAYLVYECDGVGVESHYVYLDEELAIGDVKNRGKRFGYTELEILHK
jgi:hypothetical protein